MNPVDQAELALDAANRKVAKLRDQLAEAEQVAAQAAVLRDAAVAASAALIVQPDPADGAGGSNTPGE